MLLKLDQGPRTTAEVHTTHRYSKTDPSSSWE